MFHSVLNYKNKTLTYDPTSAYTQYLSKLLQMNNTFSYGMSHLEKRLIDREKENFQ